jgi:hypothetical protein
MIVKVPFALITGFTPMARYIATLSACAAPVLGAVVAAAAPTGSALATVNIPPCFSKSRRFSAPRRWRAFRGKKLDNIKFFRVKNNRTEIKCGAGSRPDTPGRWPASTYNREHGA